MEDVQKRVDTCMEGIDKKLHEKGKLDDFLTLLEEKTGIKRIYVFLAVAGVFSIYLIFGYWAQLLCNFIGFVYPAWASIKAIESHDKDDDTKWLTYWVVYAYICVIDFFADIILSWVPFYWLVKCGFLLWCMAPTKENGSFKIYNGIILPWFLKRRETVEGTISDIKGGIKETFSKAQDTFDEKVREEAKMD